MAKTTDNPITMHPEFSAFSPALIKALDALTFTTTYPAGAVLFVEGQKARGMFLLWRGRAKLSISGKNGRTLILRVAEAGEVLGAGAAITSGNYETTAEIHEACDIGFIKQSDVLRLMRCYNEFALWMAGVLSQEYNATCRDIRDLLLSESATEKLARLLMGWVDKDTDSQESVRMKLTLTHEEIAEMIGTSRETVTRLFAAFKKKQFIEQKGSVLVIRDRGALESLIAV